MQYFLMVGRAIGVIGAIWLLYQLLATIQRAGRTLWYSPFFNFLSLGSAFLLVILLVLRWKWVSRHQLWRPVFLLFLLVSIIYITLLIPGLRDGGGPYMFMAVTLLVVQGFCFWIIRKGTRDQRVETGKTEGQT
jgi:hypothetical protein